MKKLLHAALVAAVAPAWAQPLPQQVIVTGNPLRDTDIAAPSSVLTGTALVLRRGSSLGETLDGLPGVSSTYFGPNANRPVARGQDGDRVRVLSNAGASFDASSLSFDHAVPIDPLVVERVEVLRGPAALQFGGSAVGGVVNTIDNRIPKAPLLGVSGATELRLGGAAGERSASALFETGGNGFVLHADAFGRSTENTRVPAFDRPLPGGSSEQRRQIANSASRASGGALGGSWVTPQGYLGASLDSYRSTYGIVAEEDITIQMRRDKFSLAGELRLNSGFISSLRAQAANSDYQHQEVAGDGSVGTVFKNRGADARAEAVHRAVTLGWGQLEGVVGLQLEASRFSALGEEAFVPETQTRQAAVFVMERWSWGRAEGLNGKFSAGLRVEQAGVRSSGDSDAALPQFGPAQERRFAPRSGSFAAVLNLGPWWQVSASHSTTQRAPTHYELFANGVHAATGAYERGDPGQALERGRHADLGLGWQRGPHHFKLAVFDSRFSNYLLLAATGEPDFLDATGAGLPVFNFRGVQARLYGVEAEAQFQIASGRTDIDLDFKLDTVKGLNQTRGEALPRLAPSRFTVGLTWKHGAWTTRAEAQRASAQTHVPSTDQATPGWTRLNLSTSLALNWGGYGVLLFAKLQNATNVLAYSANTVGNLRNLAPLPGRSLSGGMRLNF